MENQVMQGPPAKASPPNCMDKESVQAVEGKRWRLRHKMDIDLGDPCSGCGSDNCAKCSLCGFESHD